MRSLLLAAVLLAPAIASADDKPSPAEAPQSKLEDCATARKLNKVCVINFADEDIDVPPPPPVDIVVSPRTWANVTSLIRIRRDFNREIIDSAEDL